VNYLPAVGDVLNIEFNVVDGYTGVLHYSGNQVGTVTTQGLVYVKVSPDVCSTFSETHLSLCGCNPGGFFPNGHDGLLALVKGRIDRTFEKSPTFAAAMSIWRKPAAGLISSFGL
jgi:hypothetical protein